MNIVGVEPSESPVISSLLRLLCNEQVILATLSVLIGVAAAYANIVFCELIALLQWGGFGSLGGRLISQAGQ